MLPAEPPALEPADISPEPSSGENPVPAGPPNNSADVPTKDGANGADVDDEYEPL